MVLMLCRSLLLTVVIVTTDASVPFNGERFYRISNGTKDTLDHLQKLEINGTADLSISNVCMTGLRQFVSGMQKGEEWAWRSKYMSSHLYVHIRVLV